jgi:uncharacterized repeat protein (TIGR01451 family)
LAVDAERPVTVVLDLTAAMPLLAANSDDEETPARLTYTVDASTAIPDIDADNNHQQVVAPLTLAGSDLQLWLAAPTVDGPSILSGGQTVTYTLTYANFGNQLAAASTITMSLTPGLVLVAARPAPSQSVMAADSGRNLLSWNIGDLPAGETGVIKVQVHSDSVDASAVPILATANSPSWELNPLDNMAQAMTVERPPTVSQTSLFLPMIQN